MRRAILLTPDDASLQAQIVQLDGEVDTKELEMRFEEEDIEEREKGLGGAGGKPQDVDADTSIPQLPSPPPEMNQENDSDNMYTVKNIQAI
ncbi:hypothetical protein V500_03875 [Pseudogymnoascus sp. VKM F-4518 (FW-2643)]|nr:hypothetical protein V500_03875 [Pseudogymnoascus sp. VKM F-4518 (FW-2643)]